MSSSPIRLLPYESAPAAVRAWDPLVMRAAALLEQAIVQAVPGARVEHVGSTAVEGLPGKGYVDLQLAASRERLAAIVEALVDAGWQRQHGPHAFPPTRPLLLAHVELDDRVVKAHLHVVPEGDPELREMIAFRDALRADASLRAAYASEKARIIAGGTTFGPAYAEAKTSFIVATLRALGLR